MQVRSIQGVTDTSLGLHGTLAIREDLMKRKLDPDSLDGRVDIPPQLIISDYYTLLVL